MDIPPDLFLTASPHNRDLQLELMTVGKGSATVCMPYQEKLVGNTETGVIAGGAVTTVMDSVCGVAVYTAMPVPMAIATLDLRIDYMKPATPHKAILVTAECYRLSRHVAFVRAIAYHDDPAEPIANATAAFSVSNVPLVNMVAEHGGGTE